MNDTPTLVQFKSGWESGGTGDDGLPYYRSTILIRLDRPPLLSVERVADEQDIEDHPMPFKLFQKEQAARKQTYAEGYPLAMWPAVNEAEFRMLVDRDVTTVEQLAGLRNARGLPPELVDLANRARDLIQMQKSGAKFEPLIADLKGQIEALNEQVRDASAVISSQKATIDQLRIRGVS